MIQKYEMNGDLLESKEKLPRVMELKDLGNVHFRNKKFRAANKLYKIVLAITTDMKHNSDRDRAMINEITLACHSNRALVEMEMQNYESSEDQINKGLALNPCHEKLLYRKALLGYKRSNFEQVEDLLNMLLLRFPDNESAKLLALKNMKRKRNAKKMKKELANRMFGSDLKKLE